MTDSWRLVSRLGVVLGAALVVLGVAAYVVSDFASVTALIPAALGVLVALLAVVGRERERRRIAVYGIGLIALLGVVGSARGVPDLIALLSGRAVESSVAAVAQGATIAICLVLLAAVAYHVLGDR